MPDSELSWLNKSDPVFAGFEGLDMGLAGRHRESPESEKEQGSEESSTAYALIATAIGFGGDSLSSLAIRVF